MTDMGREIAGAVMGGGCGSLLVAALAGRQMAPRTGATVVMISGGLAGLALGGLAGAAVLGAAAASAGCLVLAWLEGVVVGRGGIGPRSARAEQ